MRTVNGVEFYRKKKRISKAALSRASGLSVECIRWCEDLSSLDNCCMETVLSLSTALGVSIDQLLEIHSEEELTRADKNFRPIKEHILTNPVAVYRLKENLTIDELAQRLGTSPWGANLICRRPTPNDKYIRRLAEAEGLSAERFLALYEAPEEAAEFLAL